MNEGAWIRYTVNRAFGEGFVVVLNGPCARNMQGYDAQAAKTSGDWINGQTTMSLPNTISSMAIPEAEASVIFDRLRNITVQPFPPLGAGINGETHELELGGVLNVARFRWFCGLPECWSAMADSLNALAGIAQQCFVQGKQVS